MTPAELRALVEAATPGPWEARDIWHGTGLEGTDHRWYVEGPVPEGYEGEVSQYDARLTALAPQLATLLADAVEHLAWIDANLGEDADEDEIASILARFKELQP